MFNPEYQLTTEVVKNLIAVAEAKVTIERAKILPLQELRLRRQAMIRMSHSSTKIEGNGLNIHQVEAVYANKKVDAPTRDIYEVENYLKALKYIEGVVEKGAPISEKVALKIHALVTDKTLPDTQAGFYRLGPIYVVRKRSGLPDKVLYTGPFADQVPEFMREMLAWINKAEKDEINPIIVAGIVHKQIALIHPFSDGNGRTARALATLILYKCGYDFRKLFALEDYYNKDRPAYYTAISAGKNYETRQLDFTPWLEYFVRGFRAEIDAVKDRVVILANRKVGEEISSQIYLTKDQIKIIDFLDQVERITVQDVIDIIECPQRTAQFELQKLKKIKMISQVGKGPSSAYILAK